MKLAGSDRWVLATEFVALALARGAGLLVPDTEPLWLTGDLPWRRAPTNATKPRSGVRIGASGSRQSSTPCRGRFWSGLPAALLHNVDRTMANPNIIRDAAGTPWAIDFGACPLIDPSRGAS